MKLHPTQQKLLEILRNNVGDPFSVRDLQDLVNASSSSVIHHHLVQLEKKGYLSRNPTNPQDYQVVAMSPEKKVVYLNLYGLAQCGPGGDFLDGNPIDKVPIASRLLGFPADKAFMVRARGRSMEPKIKDKDLVIARKMKVVDRSGEIVVCVNKGEALIKRLDIDPNGRKILVSLNSEFPPFVAADDFAIEGLVRGVLSYS